jgi:hypothetical protein
LAGFLGDVGDLRDFHHAAAGRANGQLPDVGSS